MSQTGTPSTAVEERTIKGELENLAVAISDVKSSVDSIVSILGIAPSEGQDAPKQPVERFAVQAQIAEIVDLRARVRALVPLLGDIAKEVNRIC